MEIDYLLRCQNGVVSRAQVLACGEREHDIRRRLRRREWAVVLPGVYVDHTGPLTWEQRASAGVLHAARGLDADLRPVGAALAGHSALRQDVGPAWVRERGRSVTVAIDAQRTMKNVKGFRFVRVAHLGRRVDPMPSPPRLCLPDAVAGLVLEAEDVLDVVGIVAGAARSRCVTVAAVRDMLEARPRVAGRALLDRVLQDVTDGTASALELLFIDDVVRAHGLPLPVRQLTHVLTDEGGRVEHRDAEWPGLGIVCELDGRVYHENPRQRDRDLDRDLDDAADGRAGVRLGWGQVSRRACRTARRLERILQRAGWEGTMSLCPRCQ